MIHESAWGTSFAIKQHNNPSGQMTSEGLIHYSTLDEGIEATGRTLKNLIVERKLHTVEALGSVYCPVGAANDPMGLNANWVPAIKQFITMLGGNPEASLLWSKSGGNGNSNSSLNASGKAKKVLEWAESMHRKGVIYTQLGPRGTFPYYDCSAFVTRAMEHAGIPIGLGSTDTLYSVEGKYLEPISKEDVQPGDIFVWGFKGSSGGDNGHTGIFTDNGKTIIHCTPATDKGFPQDGDVVVTPFEGYYGYSYAPVFFYRVK
ncbi:peptidoglycan amidohydrolase family protein [Enterococcus termitis]